jgi:hypothetical protein
MEQYHPGTLILGDSRWLRCGRHCFAWYSSLLHKDEVEEV